jgi:hypothetical protein
MYVINCLLSFSEYTIGYYINNFCLLETDLNVHYYNSSIALNLKQYYSKHFTVHKIQYTCIKNWHNEIKISNWKTSPNQKVYIYNI